MFLQDTTGIELEEILGRGHVVPQLKCQLWELVLLDHAEDVCPDWIHWPATMDVSRVGWDVDMLGNRTRRACRLSLKINLLSSNPSTWAA
jgi:hypothetical protein